MKFNEGGIFQEKRSIRPTFSVERIYGGTLLAMCSNDFICFYDWAECRLIRRIDVNVKVSSEMLLFLYPFKCYTARKYSIYFVFGLTYFQNLYWADSGDLVAIASDTSFYILKYNVRIPICLAFL